jgi:uncharacterized protein CbrC (UPF0167 family)
MDFRYFRDPIHFGVGYSSEAQSCSICNEVRDGFNLWRDGPDDERFVCPECLSSGKVGEYYVMGMDPDIGILRQQLKEIHPDWDDLQIEECAKMRTNELLDCTPRIETWQGFFWPAHCGDYCCFLKEVGKTDLNQLASDDDGKSFFASKLRDKDGENTPIDPVWDSIRPDSPKDKSVTYNVGVYLFQCLQCEEYVIIWDRN